MCRPAPTPVIGEGCYGLGEMSDDDAQPLHRGSGGSTCRKESALQHGKPQSVVGDDRTNRTPVRDRPGALWGGGEARSTAETG